MSFKFKMAFRAIVSLILVCVMFLSVMPLLAEENTNSGLINSDAVIMPEGSHPGGGIRHIEGKYVPQEDLDGIATAKTTRGIMRAASISGGGSYGRDWLAKQGADSAVLTAIYDRLLVLADEAYNYPGDYTEIFIEYPPEDTTEDQTEDQTDPDGEYVFIFNQTELGDLNIPYDGSNHESEVSLNAQRLLALAFSSFNFDNPQYYMISSGYLYSLNIPDQGNPVNAQISSITPVMSPSYAEFSTRQNLNAKIDAKYAEYQKLVSSVTSDFDKARLVHDKICAERDYSLIDGGWDENDYAHNIIGVMDLSTNGPVCESYAKAYSYILNRLGINNVYIAGVAITIVNGVVAEIGHTWNLVKIGGSYYYVDITWDDLEDTEGDPNNTMNDVYYKYFMVGSNNDSLIETHFISNPNGDFGNYLYDLPPGIMPTDYNIKNGSTYKYLTDNGFNSEYYGYADYDYTISFENSVIGGLFKRAENEEEEKYVWNVRPHSFGSYTVSPTATDVKVIGKLYNWPFHKGEEYINFAFREGEQRELRPDTDYEIVVERPYHTGTNRAYVYGKGTYRGVDFALVNLSFAEASSTVQNITVSGKTGTALSGNQKAIIKLTNASVIRNGLKNVDATSWFNNLPCGVTAVANGGSFSDTIEITFSGTPTYANSKALNISIPEVAQTSGAVLAVTGNSNAKFDITGTAVPVITIDTPPAALTTVMSGNIEETLSIKASVQPSVALTYTWYQNTSNSNSGGTSTGIRGETFQIPTSLKPGTYYYYCVVSAACADSVTSGVATVIVTEDTSVIVGDVNGDGKITTADAVMVLQHIAKIIVLKDNELIAADTNHDGKITTADAVLLLQYIAKIIPSLQENS